MTKDITQHLSIKDKVKLFKELYIELSGYGCDGDTELAHINPYEAQLLKSIGGSGTVNQITGLREYKGGGSPPPPPPATQSVTQQTEFPEELKPFIQDVLGKAQAIQEKRESEGYIPFEGPQVASFTPEQEQAFAGISGLVGQGQQYFDPATRLAAASAIAPRQAEVEQFMSPYMQNVVDIQQREAKRQANVAAQQLGAQAVGAGAYGGSRQAILEAEQQRNLQQQLGDIQARGLAAAYEDAQRRIAEQRGRELSASGQFMQLGQVAPQQQQRELTALEAVGAQRQAQSQRGLDIARQQFQEEQTFPERTLQQYQSVIRGFPLAPTTYQTSQQTIPAPSFLQQAAGLGTTAIGLAGAFGGFGRNAKAGGKVDPRSGLGSIVVKKQQGGNFLPPTRGRFTAPNYENPIGRDIESLIKALGRGIIDPPTYQGSVSEEEELSPRQRDFYKSRMSSPIEARIAEQEKRMGMPNRLRQTIQSIVATPSEQIRDVNNVNYPLTSKTEGIKSYGNIRKDMAEEGIKISPIIKENIKNIFTSKGSEDFADAEQLRRARDRARMVNPDYADYLDGLIKKELQSKNPTDSVGSRMINMPKTTLGIPYDEGDDIPYQTSMPDELKPLAKKVSSVTPKAGDEMPSNAEMAGYRAGLAEFAPLTSDTEAAPSTTPSTAPSTDKEEVVVAKQATNTFAQLPGSEIRDKLAKEFETLAASRKARLDARKKGLDSDRWLAVANLGANILAQPGGQTFLQAIGKGAKESGIIASLSKLNREEADIADKLDTIDVDTLMKKYQLSKDEAAEFARKRTEDRATRKLEADIKYNNDRVNLLKQQGKIEEAKLLAKRNAELRKSISLIGKPLTKEQFKNVRDVYKGYWSEISKTDKGKSIQDLLDKTKIDLDSDANITHLYKSARLIEEYEGLDQRSAYLKALNNFLKGISPAKN